MQRWALVRDGVVRGVILGSEPDDAAKRALVFGASEDAGERDLTAEGKWHRAPEAVIVGDGWLFDGTTFTPPMPGMADYGRVVGEHVDAVARERDYTDGVSCASYASDPDLAFRAEALAFVAWRGGVWRAVAGELAKVQQGGTPPTLAGLVDGLPNIVWPA